MTTKTPQHVAEELAAGGLQGKVEMMTDPAFRPTWHQIMVTFDPIHIADPSPNPKM